MITLNNPTDEEQRSLTDALTGRGVTRASVGHEVGESGTPHLQGFVQLKNGRTLTAMKQWLGSKRWNLQVARSLQDAWDYCRKGCLLYTSPSPRDS